MVTASVRPQTTVKSSLVELANTATIGELKKAASQKTDLVLQDSALFLNDVISMIEPETAEAYGIDDDDSLLFNNGK